MLSLCPCRFDSTKQFLNVLIQRASNVAKNLYRDVSLASFDTANICPVTPRSSSQSLLRPTPLLTKSSYTGSELLLNGHHWAGVSAKIAMRDRDYEYYFAHPMIAGTGHTEERSAVEAWGSAWAGIRAEG